MLDGDEHGVELAFWGLPEDERCRADRLRSAVDRKAFVLSHAVQRGLLAAACQRPLSRIRFGRGPQGKPFLAGKLEGPRFSMSDSGDVAAYALAWSREVGVDVEQNREVADWREIAERFFSWREHRELLAVPEPDREAAFFRCWVRKEAYVKARGGGLSIPTAFRRGRTSWGPPWTSAVQPLTNYGQHGASRISLRLTGTSARSPPRGRPGRLAFTFMLFNRLWDFLSGSSAQHSRLNA
jgi:hypothetical protein